MGTYEFWLGRRRHWRNTFVVWFWWSRGVRLDMAPGPREMRGPAYRFPRRFGKAGRSWNMDADLYVLRPLVPLVRAAWWWMRHRWVIEHALMYAGVLTYPRYGEYAKARIPELVPDTERPEHRLFDWRRREFRSLDGSWSQRMADDFSWWDGMRFFFGRWS